MTEVKLEGYPSVGKWLSGINESTRKGYLWHLESFMDWVRENSVKFGSMTPDELVEFCLDATPRQINEFLDTKKAYLLSLKGRLSHKANGDKAIKSYFAHNRVELPSDKTLNLQGDKPKVEGTLTPEDIKRVILSSNVTYQAVFLTMLGSGMGQSEFVSWSDEGYEELQRQLDKDAKLVKVSLHGRKGDKNQYNYSTFIGGDALAALKRYLNERGTRPGAIFINTHGEPLTKVALYRYWTRKLIRIGIKTKKGWTGTNTHEIRDVYRTLWRRSGVPVEYGEYYMGHREAFDKYGYDKTALDEDELRKQYEAALPILNILSETRPFKLVHEDMVAKLQRELEEAKNKLARFDDWEQRMIALERFAQEKAEKEAAGRQ
jgi:integrase